MSSPRDRSWFPAFMFAVILAGIVAVMGFIHYMRFEPLARFALIALLASAAIPLALTIANWTQEDHDAE